jgi:hypothetical protein
VISDSILGLIGNTHVAALHDNDVQVQVKLEGDNPSGSVFDRLLTSATFTGTHIQIRQHDQLAAAVALAAGALGLPLTLLTASPTSNAARMAAAFGATVEHSTQRGPGYHGIDLHIGKSLATLVQECAAVGHPHRDRMLVLPAVYPLVTDPDITAGTTQPVLALLDGSVQVPLLPADPAARTRLAHRGLLLDELSATCVEWAIGYARQHPDTTVVAIAACDGAITPQLSPAIIVGQEMTCTPAW